MSRKIQSWLFDLGRLILIRLLIQSQLLIIALEDFWIALSAILIEIPRMIERGTEKCRKDERKLEGKERGKRE